MKILIVNENKIKMKELSKQEKINLLLRTKEIIIGGYADFICVALEAAASENEGREFESSKYTIEKYVPELLKYKPKHTYLDSAVWFNISDRSTRIEIINKTIKDIEASIASTLESD